MSLKNWFGCIELESGFIVNFANLRFYFSSYIISDLVAEGGSLDRRVCP